VRGQLGFIEWVGWAVGPGEVGLMAGVSGLSRTAAVVAGAVGGLSSAAYGLLMAQSERARIVIWRAGE